MKGKTNRSYHFYYFFPPCKSNWEFGISKNWQDLLNYASFSVITEPSPYICNMDFGTNPIIMQGKYYRISDKNDENFDMDVKTVTHYILSVVVHVKSFSNQTS